MQFLPHVQRPHGEKLANCPESTPWAGGGETLLLGRLTPQPSLNFSPAGKVYQVSACPDCVCAACVEEAKQGSLCHLSWEL